eukprot:COSAG01_NODE_15858_length_1291_cov_5.591367_1_plen_48_part_10
MRAHLVEDQVADHQITPRKSIVEINRGSRPYGKIRHKVSQCHGQPPGG